MATNAIDMKIEVPEDEGNALNEKVTKKKAEDDVWAIVMDEPIDYVKFKDMSGKQKVAHVFVVIGKISGVLLTLYLFICSLSLMSSAFQILGGKTGGQLFTNEYLSNPVTGLIIGILVTVLVQSSSTSTSIITTMVGAGSMMIALIKKNAILIREFPAVLNVHEAIPIIMGTNIGTSVTNTIVALTQSMDRNKFRKSFGGATVHDMFNFLCVVILLPIEVITGYLEKLTTLILSDSNLQGGQSGGPEFLDVITDPMTDHVIQVNKSIITLIAQDIPLSDAASMINIWCSYKDANVTVPCNETQIEFDPNCTVTQEMEIGQVECTTKDFIFANTGLPDPAVGSILLVLSLIVLTTCLVLMVKLLSSMLKGSVALIIKKVVNTNLPYPFGWISGYLAIVTGAILTFLVQSSSVFTSTITPLVGMGIISLKRMFPLTLGSNIGTTATSILAALATDNDYGVIVAMQIALCHFFFNVTGILIWYPIPVLRRVPIRAAMFLGNTTADYRWFAVVYLLFAFFLIPCVILGLSIAGIWIMGGFLILAAVIIVTVIIINVLQSRKPNWLPQSMRTWEFLPKPMRSLEPYDKFFTKTLLCCKSCKEDETRGDGEVDSQYQYGEEKLQSSNNWYSDATEKEYTNGTSYPNQAFEKYEGQMTEL